METVYVTYAADGVTITGVFANPQSFPVTQIAATDPTVLAFLNSVVPQTVASQDLIAQFTVADYSAITTAITANPSFGLLWSALQAQGGPMIVTNARFLAGWSALVTVLGQARMTAIASALNVTVT
jgi:hypothetical protein